MHALTPSGMHKEEIIKAEYGSLLGRNYVECLRENESQTHRFRVSYRWNLLLLCVLQALLDVGVMESEESGILLLDHHLIIQIT